MDLENTETSNPAGRIRGLSSQQRAALGTLLRRGAATKHAPITRMDQTEGVPLSSGQQRLWFLDQWQPGNPAYNLPAIFPLPHPADLPAVEHALDAIVRRHASLRTRFRIAGGEPVQDVLPAGPVEFRRVAVSPDVTLHSDEQVSALIREEIQRPFDLQHGPLFRAALFTNDHTESLLVLTVHHIVADGWSMSLLYQGFGSIYHAFRQGCPAPLADLPIQYTDFAIWQRRRLNSDLIRAQVEYWRRQLEDAPILDLPTSYSRPPSPTYRGALHSFLVPVELREQLKRLANSEQATTYMVLLSAFLVLLHRYTGQKEIVVGSPVAGRNRPETEHLIGFFVNTLAIRLNAGGQPSFREVLSRVRKVVLEALDHQEVPFERLVHELQLERDLSRNPLFQVTFQLFMGPSPANSPQDVSALPISIDKRTAVFDIAFNLWESSRGIEGRMEYSSDLFDGGYAGRMAQHYVTLLDSVVSDPEQCIGQLALLTAAEKGEILVAWNNTGVAQNDARCVHELFEEQAEMHRERHALTCGNRTVTYAELNLTANRIVHRLRELGVGLETPVGVCLQRSPELVAAMLGVMKAGGVYVPIDSSYPPERIATILRDCDAAVLIAQQPLQPELSFPISRVLFLDQLAAGARDANPAEPRARTDSLAYILYTSGSTGAPKGVEIEHRALRNLIDWHCRTYQVTRQDRATQIASISFDASVWEILPYLAAGACVCIVDDEMRLDPGLLLGWMAAEHITICFLPTPLAEAVLRLPLPSELRIRALLTGGDRLRHPPAEALPFKLINHYGPTENTVVTTSGIVQPGTRVQPSIGRPISNNSLYILDDNLQPLPVGVPGEICIGGGSLSRGYRNRPAITAERFVPNPFDPHGATRLYKTGDLARFRPDGEVEFLGRTDRQIKIRGFRVELGEIEAVMRECRGIVEALVTVHEDRVRGKELSAHYVSQSFTDPRELRDHLAGRLPDYMIPSRFNEVESMPLTLNFKVDRLRLNGQGHPHIPGEGDTAENAVEKVLAGIWSEVLNIDAVGVHDNFFTDCGGHSLLSVSLASRIREALQIDLPLRAIFEAPTVRQLADRLRADPGERRRVDAIARLLLRFLDTLDEEAEASVVTEEGADQ
jgi:amino acid adenylation domain-containing protein